MTGLEAPAIIGIVGAVVGAVGTGVSIYSSIQQQNAAAEAAEAEQEAKNLEATTQRQAAEFEERQFRRKAQILIGRQRNLMAASGIDITTGSPALMELDTIEQAEIEALNIRRTGQVRASALEFEGRLSGQRATYGRSNIPWMYAGGAVKAGSSILSSWYTYNKASKGVQYPAWYMGGE